MNRSSVRFRSLAPFFLLHLVVHLVPCGRRSFGRVQMYTPSFSPRQNTTCTHDISQKPLAVGLCLINALLIGLEKPIAILSAGGCRRLRCEFLLHFITPRLTARFWLICSCLAVSFMLQTANCKKNGRQRSVTCLDCKSLFFISGVSEPLWLLLYRILLLVCNKLWLV